MFAFLDKSKEGSNIDPARGMFACLGKPKEGGNIAPVGQEQKRHYDAGKGSNPQCS